MMKRDAVFLFSFFAKHLQATKIGLVLSAACLAAALFGCNPQPDASAKVEPIVSPIKKPAPPTPPTVTALPSTANKISFVDITEDAGIHWTHFSGARGKKYMPECETPGCAFLDYNNDGKPDILLLNGADWPEITTGRKQARLALYRNDGNGHFTDVTKQVGLDIEMHAMGVAVGDYDNDGFDDLYITCVLGPSHLFHNDGKGHFTDVTRQAGVDNENRWGSAAAWVDYDKDGKLDLIVGNYCIWTPKTDKRCSVYAGKKSYCTPAVYDGEPLRLYHNEGHGAFKDVTKKAGIANLPGKTWGISILDYDDDGWPDIAVANDLEPNLLFHNQKNGTFKEIGLIAGVALAENGAAKAGMGIDAADIDNSGRPSLMVSNFSGEGLSLFQNMGKGQFIESAHQWQVSDVSLQKMGWGLFFFDYDLDGRVDALVANGHLYDNVHEFQPDITYAETPLVFHNEGGVFKEVVESLGPDLMKPMVARGAAYADIDGDGDLDVLIMANDGSPRLLRNDGGNANHWLRVQTVGVKSNRDGLGAKLVVEAGGVRQTRWVRNTSSFLSCSELTVTFGLGPLTKADKLTITWPSGQVDTYVNPPTNQTLTAKEGVSQN